MSINNQENLRIGSVNSPTGSDTLFAAFKKIQNNFNRVFSSASNISIISSGPGIDVSGNVVNVGPAGSNATSNIVTITNTGVTSINAGTGIAVSGNTGAVTINSTTSGTVTSVGIVTNSLVVSGGPIVNAGTISINLPTSVPLANFVANAAQPNITSVGTLSNLTVSGTTNLRYLNMATNGVANLGNVGNVKIAGGATNYFLKTDGNGNLDWAPTDTAQASGNVIGSIQFRSRGGAYLDSSDSFYWSDGQLDPGYPRADRTPGLHVSGATLGDVTGVRIFGGKPGQVLVTDGFGNLRWADANIAPPPSIGIDGGNATVIPTLALDGGNAGTSFSGIDGGGATVVIAGFANGGDASVTVTDSLNGGISGTQFSADSVDGGGVFA
jgi:hypothetical protein